MSLMTASGQKMLAPTIILELCTEIAFTFTFLWTHHLPSPAVHDNMCLKGHSMSKTEFIHCILASQARSSITVALLE